MRHALRTVALAAGFLLLAGSATAAIQRYEAMLRGAHETPPNASHARGEVTAELDTDKRELDYDVTFSGLSGPPTAAVLQLPGAAAGFARAPNPINGSEIHGQVQLTHEQVNDLNAGHFWFNIKTMAEPGGEISGDLERTGGAY